MLTKNDRALIKRARALVGTKKVLGGALKEVGCVLMTEKGKMFQGVSLHLPSGIGFCAEHSAIAAMVTNTNETRIRTIVAASKDGPMPPCGRCRELMSIIDAKNVQANIIISSQKKVTLKELLPFAWSSQ